MKKNKKKISVSIGVPAYNEEQNIRELLTRLLSQQQESFSLKEIIVVDDASADMTRNEIKRIKDKRVTLIKHKTRKGQNFSQNEILAKFQGDAVMFIEADTVPKNRYFLEELVCVYLSRNKHEVMVVGYPTPSVPNLFYERVQSLAYLMKMELFSSWKNGVNVYSCTGHATKLLSGSFAKKFRWPASVPEDAYIYLFLIKHGFSFKQAKNARVILRCVQSLGDRARQLAKFRAGKKSLQEFFPKQLIVNEYSIPKTLQMSTIFRNIFKNKQMTILYILDYILQWGVTSRYGRFKKDHPAYLTTKNIVV